MKEVSIDSKSFLEATRKPSGLDKLARRVIRSRLKEVRQGEIVFTENGETQKYGAPTDAVPLTAHITVTDPRFYSEVAFGGTIGSGEAWIHNYWTCSDLTALVRILLRNSHVLLNMDSGAAMFTRPLQRLLHWLNRNTKRGSQRNIAAHYDLGNSFYSLWLDDTMMYSSAVFSRPGMSLKEASVEKLDLVCRKLGLSAEDSVVEIGTGWGGFAIHAAKQYGCHVTTTTISKEQFDYADAAIRKHGLEDRITLLLKDYRELDGEYDKLVSIEMIEAVGHKFHDTFFAKCARLLKPHGQMLLQAITIADQHYERYKKGVDFINRYIFPGGCLTSVTGMTESLTRVTDMRAVHIEDIGPHYATTLNAWREGFFARLDEVRELGYSEAFIRMWQYYLCYCEGGFAERAIGNVHMLLMRPEARPRMTEHWS
ncbi:MAG: cyclopropane-fatty-acyl-phospholipid synthase family protein [Pseudomonadota bacterium]